MDDEESDVPQDFPQNRGLPSPLSLPHHMANNNDGASVSSGRDSGDPIDISDGDPSESSSPSSSSSKDKNSGGEEDASEHGDGDGEDEDEDEAGEAAEDDGLPSMSREQLEHQYRVLKQEVAVLTGQLDTKKLESAAQRTRANQAQAQVQTLREQLARRHNKHTQRTWARKLRLLLTPPGGNVVITEGAWTLLYKVCCKEENMSTRVKMVHPDIELATPAIIVPGGRCRDPFSARWPQVPNNGQPFPFEELPMDIQDKIFRLWLYKDGFLVHCFSRLDPYQPLEHFPTEEELGARRSGLPRGFFWAHGRTKCSLTHDVRRPNDVLRLLLVNKHFYFIGVHCFYALNTFAFSSLGEFGRFTKGIGKARMERLQFIELMFMGNQFLTVEPENKKLPPYSLRTSAIRCLPECRRLRTLVFHINETGKDYVRRRYESEEVKQHMIGQTRGQPNIRLSRSFRTLQGLDYLTTLRGLNWVRFYDLEQAANAGSGERFPIRDWSYMEDITNVCTLEKVPSRKAACDIRNLTSVNPGWNPTQQHWGVVRRYFVDRAGDLSYDAVRVPVNNRDADVRSRNSAAAQSRASSSESSESDTHSRRSSSSSSSSSGSGGGDGRRGDRTGRTRESILLETDIDSDSDDDRAFSAVNSVDFPRRSRGASTTVLARGRRLSTSISISSSSDSGRSSPDDTTSGVGATADEPITVVSSDDDGGDDSNSDSKSSTSDLFVNQRSGSQADSEGSREGSETPTPTVIDLVGEDEDEDEDGTPQPAPRNGVEPSPSASQAPFNSFLRSNQPPLWLPNRPLPGMGGSSPLHSAAGATGTGSSSMPPGTRETTRESTGLFVTPTPRALVAGVPSRSITPLHPSEAGHANQDMAAEIHCLGVELEIVDLTDEPEGPYAISEGVPPRQEGPSTPRASPPASPWTTKRSSVHDSRSPSPAAKRHCRTP